MFKAWQRNGGKKSKEKKSYLRCEVLWRATEGLHGSSVCDAFLAEAEISDFHVAVFIEHQVFQLEGKQNTNAAFTTEI